MYLRLLNGEENHAKEVAGRLKEIYEKINTHSRKKGTHLLKPRQKLSFPGPLIIGNFKKRAIIFIIIIIIIIIIYLFIYFLKNFLKN